MTQNQLGRVVFWMTGTLLSFSVMAVSVRGLAGALSIFEILCIRSGTGVLILTTLVLARPEMRTLIRPRRMGMHLVRNSVHYASQYAWALSVTILPFATVFALEFTMPAWTTLLAVFLLGERLTPSRIGAIVLGIAGVVVIVQPGMATFQPAALIVLAAAFGYAVSSIATKSLTKTESTFAIIFWMNVMQFPMSFVASDPGFLAKLGSGQILPALGVALSGLASHFCLTNALRYGDASVVVPIDFLRIPLIAAVGWFFYGETLEAMVYLGALIIISGVLWNLRDERRGR